MIMRVCAFYFFCVLICCLVAPLSVRGAADEDVQVFTVTVSSDNDCSDLDCDFESALIAAAQSGCPSRVEVGAGTMTGPDTIMVYPSDNMPLEIRGAGTDETTVTCGLLLDTSGLADDSNNTITLGGITFSGSEDLEIRTDSADIVLGDIGYDGSDDKDIRMESQSGNIIILGSLTTNGDISLNSGTGENLNCENTEPLDASGIVISSGIDLPENSNVITGCQYQESDVAVTNTGFVLTPLEYGINGAEVTIQVNDMNGDDAQTQSHQQDSGSGGSGVSCFISALLHAE